MTKPIAQMTAEEYKQFLLNSPDEAKKLDEAAAPAIVPTVVWRNGVAVQIAQPSQTAQNGVIQG
jgi:hypothetical protein